MSRKARYAYLLVLCLLVVGSLALHLESYIYQRNVRTTLATLEMLQLDKSDRAEVLRKIPELSKKAFEEPLCRSMECYSFEKVGSRPGTWLLDRVSRLERVRNMLYPALYYAGLRENYFSANVAFKSGKLVHVGYELWLSNGTPDELGTIRISVASRHRFDFGFPEQDDVSPDFRVWHLPRLGNLGTKITFTPGVPSSLLHHAFDPKLNCVWSFSGCKNASQILPEAEQVRLNILQAADVRMHEATQCPERFLPRRARDATDILLMQVVKVGPRETDYSGTQRRIDLRVVRTLKGRFDKRLEKDVAVLEKIGWDDTEIHNSSYDLLQPGRQLLLFPDESLYIDGLCEAVPATNTALKTVEDVINSSRTALGQN